MIVLEGPGKNHSTDDNRANLANNKLEEELKVLIRENAGMISFATFMEACLYSQEGYYNSQGMKTGKDGDFYTAPNVSPVFGEVIADYIYQEWQKTVKEQVKKKEVAANNSIYNIIEYGAGRGQLARAILDRLDRLMLDQGSSYNYYIIEKSQAFRDEQKDFLADYPVTWLEEIADFQDEATSGQMIFVLANELLDAFPVHLVQETEGELVEIYVAYDQTKDEFIEVTGPASDDLLAYFQDQDIIFEPGQRAEVNLEARAWLREVTRVLDSSRDLNLIIIDYGYEAEDLYAPHHKEGTLMCYYQHQAHDNPYINLGQQDITSHVNFSVLATWAREEGYEVEDLQTQGQFLVDQGIYNKIESHNASDPFSPAFKKNLAIKQLILPATMGQNFKFFIAKRRQGDRL